MSNTTTRPPAASPPVGALTMRPATAADAPELARLAQLDSAAVPDGPVLLALVDGRAVAALGLDSGAVVADPFAPTADLVALLRARAAATTPPVRRAAVAARLRAVRRWRGQGAR